MRAGSKAILILERGLLLLGLLLLAMFAFAYIHRFMMSRAGIAKFETRQLEFKNKGSPRVEAPHGANNASLQDAQNPDNSLGSTQGTQLYQASVRKPFEPLAVLRIPALHLEVPVLEGTDEVTLNRGVGRIAGTSLPGEEGNIGIAGHRDGFFRKLKNVRTGDAIELVTVAGTDVFIADQIRITNPANVSVLRPRAKRSLTLVTCYPFYFVGPAPNRYVVEASLRERGDENE